MDEGSAGLATGVTETDSTVVGMCPSVTGTTVLVPIVVDVEITNTSQPSPSQVVAGVSSGAGAAGVVSSGAGAAGVVSSGAGAVVEAIEEDSFDVVVSSGAGAAGVVSSSPWADDVVSSSLGAGAVVDATEDDLAEVVSSEVSSTEVVDSSVNGQ